MKLSFSSNCDDMSDLCFTDVLRSSLLQWWQCGPDGRCVRLTRLKRTELRGSGLGLGGGSLGEIWKGSFRMSFFNQDGFRYFDLDLSLLTADPGVHVARKAFKPVFSLLSVTDRQTDGRTDRQQSRRGRAPYQYEIITTLAFDGCHIKHRRVSHGVQACTHPLFYGIATV